MSNQLPKPGSYSLQVAQIISADRKFNADITGFISTLNFIESMDFMGSRGSVVLVDAAQNLLASIPVLGDELIYLEWTTPAYRPGSKKTRRQFIGRITGIKEISLTESREAMNFKLNFIDELAYDQAFNNISLAYSDTLSNIAQKIYDKAVNSPIQSSLAIPKLYKTFQKDDTQGVVNMIIPNEAPFDAMEYLLGHCHSSDKKSCLWYFFQNKDGYHFRSLEDLVKTSKDELKASKEALEAFTYKYSYEGMLETTDNREVAYNLLNLYQFARDPGFETFEKGGLNQAVNEVDYIFKNVNRTEKQFNYGDYDLFDTELNISQHALDTYGKEPNSTEYVYSDGTKTNKSNLPESIINKKFMSAYLYSNMIQVKIPGNADVSPGGLLNLQVTDIQKILAEPGAPISLDSSFSGLFLIKDVTHTFVTDGYLQTVTLTRSGDNAE